MHVCFMNEKSSQLQQLRVFLQITCTQTAVIVTLDTSHKYCTIGMHKVVKRLFSMILMGPLQSVLSVNLEEFVTLCNKSG